MYFKESENYRLWKINFGLIKGWVSGQRFLNWNWQGRVTLILLFFLMFNLSAPSALAMFEVKSLQGKSFAETLIDSAKNFWGGNGVSLPKFADKQQALEEKKSTTQEVVYQLVAVLVDEDIANNQTEYDGLISSHNPKVPVTKQKLYTLVGKTLMDRISRYALDVQSFNQVVDQQSYVKTVIIKVKKQEKTSDIAAALEKLYLEGDGTKQEKNRLSGVVIIGDVPLPVVNKNGNKFISMFPYTDFDDPYYIYDPQSDDFIVNTAVQKVQPEVWEGIIKPPVGGEEGNKLLAEYLDKNHLYKVGDPEYHDFAKKLFYSDLQKEFKLMGADGLPKYFNYLKYWEDISYFRYNKNWLKKLFESSSAGKNDGDGIDNDGDSKIDEDPVNGYDDDGDGEDGSPLFGLINGKDDDGDGKIDNDEEGVWGYCGNVSAKGPTKLQNCGISGKPYKTGNHYNTVPGAKYKITDGINNNPETNSLIDEGIDEDDGDPFKGIDNDRDGRVDEDTSQDNDADKDGKVDEDLPGDMNGDGCPGVCGVDENLDSLDADGDMYPDGYEKELGSLSLSISGLKKLMQVVAEAPSHANPKQFIKEAFASMNEPTNAKDFFGFPIIKLSLPLLPDLPIPRIFPFPSASDWVDNSVANDDDEDFKVDEDGTADNDNDQDGQIDEDPGDPLGGDSQAGDIFANLPDIRTKDQIEGQMAKYNVLFDKFYAEINTWIDSTGRYSRVNSDGLETKSDLVTFPFLIAAKDEFTRIYLKAVNDAVEAKMDTYVKKLQYDIQLVRGASISGYAVLDDTNGVFPANQHIALNQVDFINFGYRNDDFYAQLEATFASMAVWVSDPAKVQQIKEKFLAQTKMPLNSSTPILINGRSIDKITSIQDCSLYRGSNGTGEQSQMVYGSTVFDPNANLNTDPAPSMPEEWKSYDSDTLIGTDGNDYHGLFWQWNNSDAYPLVPWLKKQRVLNKAFAGCFSENSTKPERCFVGLALRNIFSLGGTKAAESIPESAVSHQACFDFKEKSGYDAFALKAYEYLKAISEKSSAKEKDDLDASRPDPSEVYKAPKDIKLLDFASNPPTQYELPQVKYTPIPSALLTQAANSPVLQNYSIDLEQILKNYFWGDRVDNNQNGTVDEMAENKPNFFMFNSGNGQPNWAMVGDQLLSRPRTNENAQENKDKPLKFGSGVIPGAKEVYLRINVIPGQEISSLVMHKEPTIDTLEAQTYDLARDADGNFIEDTQRSDEEKQTLGKYKTNGTTDQDGVFHPTETRSALSIPIDSPRYVSFRDAKGDYQKIVYPNAFQANNLTEYLQQLKDTEAKLASIPVNPKHAAEGPASVDGLLTGVLQDVQDNDVPGNAGKVIAQASVKKLTDAFNWKGFDLDQKHQYALQSYWGVNNNPFTDKVDSAKGYEVLYLNSSGDADKMSMKFNKDIPGTKSEPKVEKLDCSLPENKLAKACKGIFETTSGQATGNDGGYAGGSEDDSMMPVFLTEWFAALKKWKTETEDIVSGKAASIKACPVGGMADKPDDSGYNPNTIATSQAVNLNPAKGDTASLTSKLNLTLEQENKNVLRTGTADQAVLLVEAQDKKGVLNSTDNTSQIKLVITTVKGTDPVIVMVTAGEDQLTGGKTKFTVKVTENSGVASVKAVTENNGKEIASNKVVLTSTAENIKLMSYRRYNTYKFTEGATSGYLILDGNGKTIAEVDPKTGYITVNDNKYQVEALKSEGNKPMHLRVISKAEKKVMAVLYFVVDEAKAIVVDDEKMDYFSKYAELNGVHVKDLDLNDQYALVKDQIDPAKLAIIGKGIAFNNGKVGLIDKRGNVFLYKGLGLKQKTGVNSASPVVFVVVDENGKELFEIYVAAKFEVITELSWDKVETFLGNLPAAKETAGLWEIGKKQLLAEWDSQTSYKLALLQIAHAAETLPDSDLDGLNDLEELLIGTDLHKADTNGDSINDMDSLKQGLDPVKKDTSLFKDMSAKDEGFTDVLKLYKRGLFVADKTGSIRPKDSITREEFIKLDLGGICIICDNFKENIQKSVWSIYSFKPFPDKNISSEYKYCVAEGKNRGIISGYKAYENAGNYIPEGKMTRAEATKVILETSRQQLASFPEFVNEDLTGKPWYYNYVLTAQREGIYPKGKVLQIDQSSPADFKKYFDQEITNKNSQLILWLSQPISRVEFAMMISRFVDKYDCMKNDQDGDGLPDNFEKYIYATSPVDEDSDKGGVKDQEEVFRGTDPNNPLDDFPTSKPPVKNKPTLDPNLDPDQDGLTSGEEEKIGTDPLDPDTDKGGVTDGNEVLLGIDPLNKDDDQEVGKGLGLEGQVGQGQDGSFVSGIEVNTKKIYSLPNDYGSQEEQINTEETDRLPADGESEIYVRATIYGDNGEIKDSDNSSTVRFGFKNSEDGKSARLEPLNVKVKNGVAETKLVSKTKTGLPIVIASVDGKNIPSDEKEIQVYALDPAKANIKAVSPVIPNGGYSKTDVRVQLLDKNDNLCNNGSYTVTLDNGEATNTDETSSNQADLAQIDKKLDEDPNKPGVQISSVTGEFKAQLISGALAQLAKVRVKYESEVTEATASQTSGTSVIDTTAELTKQSGVNYKAPVVTASTDVTISDDLNLLVKSAKNELKANGIDETTIQLMVTDKDGKKIENYTGEVNIRVTGKGLAVLVDQEGKTMTSKTLMMTDSEAKIVVRSTHLAGPIGISFIAKGIKPAKLALESYAFQPIKIALEAENKSVEADPNQVYSVQAKLYDNDNNLVKRDNNTNITFSIDPESAKFGKIVSAQQVKVNQGQANVSFTTGTLTGPLRIRAKGKDLVDGYIEIQLNDYFKGTDFKKIQPKILFASLLGSAFGEVTKENYVGGWFVFSGKAESAVSLVADPKPKVRLAEVLPTGVVKINEAGNLSNRVEIADEATKQPNLQVVTDESSKQDVWESFVVLKPQTAIRLSGSLEDVVKDKEMVNVVNLVTDEDKYQFTGDTDKVVLVKEGEQIAVIGREGRITLNSPDLTISNLSGSENKEINWVISDAGNEIAQIIIATGDLGNVKILDNQFTFGKADIEPGVYLKMLANLPDRQMTISYSGNSSAASKGYYYTDTTQDLSESQAPGLSYLSLESSDKADGIGFTGDNKHILLFAAGSSVGEANLPYASDGGVVLGDPTIRLDNKKNPETGDNMYSGTGYTEDIGKEIFADTKTIKDVTVIDYDNDGDKDLFVLYEDGKIRLLENENKGTHFQDKGVFLNLPNGALSATAMDINDDGWDDLVVAETDSCKVGEVCVDAYLNNHTNFVRQNLNLQGFSARNKAYVLKSADMNGDGDMDLVTTDDTGSIRIFYNHAGNIDLQGTLVGNLGASINEKDNLKQEVAVNYQGMIGNMAGDSDDKYFSTLDVDGQKVDFKAVDQDAILGISTLKQAQNISSTNGTLGVGDEIKYTIKLVNPTKVAISKLMVADVVANALTVDKEDIKCVDCKTDITVAESGQSLRPYVISGIDLPAGVMDKNGKYIAGSRTITYTGKVKSLPKLKIAIANNISKNFPVKDNLPDIMATPEGNPTGQVVYFYSIGLSGGTGSKVNYGKKISDDPNKSSSSGYQQLTDANGKKMGLDFSMFDKKGADGVPEAVKYFMDYGTFPGESGGTSGSKQQGDTLSQLPGVGGAYDSIGESLDEVANKLEETISSLTCSGGCIPMPINYSFLTPGTINVLGAPGGFDPGLPVFAWGVPSLVPIWPPSPYQASAGGRIYVSPTLTGKVAVSTCLGMYLVGFGTPVPGNCFTVIVPDKFSPLKGLCDKMAGAMEGAVAFANSTISDVSGKIGLSSSGEAAANAPASGGRNYTGGFQASKSLGNYDYKASANVNVRMPGFPSVLTNWLDNQTSEIINKLTDLPDIYVLIPDVPKLVKDTATPFKTKPADDKKTATVEPVSKQGLTGVLNQINQIPLISIVPQEVLVKIPSLSPAELDRLINDSKQWVVDEKAELNRALNIWKCGPFKETIPDENGKMVPGYLDEQGNKVYGDRPYNKVCDVITADFSKTIKSVEKNIEVLEGYKQIPRQILAWRNMLTKYVVQVICYIDAIINFFVGNISKWLNQANAWVDAVAKVIEVIGTWKMMFDLVIDYQTSCDTCSSARFTLLELILKLFAFIPDPPIIPFPKLPDIYLDFSQVQMGIKILWPDIKFRPERIVLPKLPRIYLPDLPTVRINFPEIPVLPELGLNLPELPDLPPLSLPVLPNLPPPPKIPELPASIKATISILKKIFKILCLIKKGFIPTSEMTLKTTVEHMTERGLNPLLNLDLGLAFQSPTISYDFYDRIVLATKLKLGFDFSGVYNVVQNMADKMNSVSTNLVKVMNEATKKAQAAADNAANAANNAAASAVPTGVGGEKSLLNYLPDKKGLSGTELNNQFASISPLLGEYVASLGGLNADLKNDAKRYQELIDKEFQDIHLVAQTDLIKPGDARLNKSLKDLDLENMGEKMLALGDGFKETKKLASLRENLLAYAKSESELNTQKLDVNNLVQFSTMLAKAPSMTEVLAKSGYSGGTMLAAGPEDKLLAQTPSINDVVKNSGIDPKKLSQQVVKGMFIYDEAKKQNEKLIKYEDELKSATTMNFVDTNGDSQDDLVYSFGGNIYLKNNYLLANKDKGDFYGGKPQVMELMEMVPAARAVTGFVVNYNGNKNTDISWNASIDSDGGTKNLTGYELIYGEKMKLASESLQAPGLSKLVLINSADKLDQDLTNSLLQPGENNYQFPASKLYQMVAVDVQGKVVFDGPEQKVYAASQDKITLAAEQQVFSTQDTVLKVFDDGVEKDEKKMMENELLILPKGLSGKLEMQVVSGSITVIDPQKITKNQLLQNGYKIDLDVLYKSEDGGNAQITLPNNAYTRVDVDQNLTIKILDNPDKPSTSLQLENGFYYGTIRSFDNVGFRSNRATVQMFGPNICADRQAPMPLAGPAEREVAVYNTLKIDATKSFDPLGGISAYYIDTDLTYDSNGDGDPTNDKNLGRHIDNGTADDSTLNDPVFYLGPYKDLNDRKVMLNVVDESGNIGQQEITIKIFVPQIMLDESSGNLTMEKSGEGGKVSGSIDPALADIPITVLRDRGGVVTPIKTVSGGNKGTYITDKDGKFAINDLILKDSVVIKNEKGEVIAEIDPKTGRVILKNPLYSIAALPAVEPQLPTRVVVKDPSGKVVSTIFVVSDANTDVTIDTADFPYNAGTVAIFKGVHIKNKITQEESNNLEIRAITGKTDRFSGGVEIMEKSTQERLALLDTGGNFYEYDPRIDLELKTADNLADPMIFEVTFQREDGSKISIAEFHISVNQKKPIGILSADKFKMFAEDPQKLFKNKALQRNKLGAKVGKYTATGLQLSGSPFIDLDVKNPYFQSVMNLLSRGILAGIPAGNSLRFGLGDPLQRAEFAKMMLDIFCIVPRPEAYTAPAVFTDMPFVEGQVPWYFAPVKEAYFQGFITGYLGKIDIRTGRTPFLPEETISKAEAVKVILEALEKKGVISLKNVAQTEPYYTAYLNIAENLTPNLLAGKKLKTNYIITPEEAVNPEKPISRGDFVKLADRVLSAYDCTLFDTDGDGMPDFWENLHGLKPLDPGDANLDPDGDKLSNLEEYKHGTDPKDEDTDKGGVKDGDEILIRFSDPLNAEDDQNGEGGTPSLTDPRQDLDPGIYVIQEPCVTCPCPSAIEHTADLIAGDKILAVITGENGADIFSQSNPVVILEVKENEGN